MSDPPSAPQNASPLVRLESEAASSDTTANHALAPCQTLSPAITPSASLAPATTSSTFPLLLPPSKASKFQEQLPQLSERDSIFATHYLATDSDSAATTPRLPPALRSRNDNNRLQQDAASHLELPAPFSSQATAPTLLPRQQCHAASITPQASHTNLSKPVIGTVDISRSNLSTTAAPVTRSADDLGVYRSQPQVLTLQNNPSHTRDISYRKQDVRPPPHHISVRMSATWSQSDADSPNASSHLTGTTEEVQHQDKSKRNSSRGHIDKQIEATLANAEPLPNARSRKASHYLGLFKENTISAEPKKTKEKAKDVSNRRISRILEASSSDAPEVDKEDLKGTTSASVAPQLEEPTPRIPGDGNDTLEVQLSRPRFSRNASSSKISSRQPSDISNHSRANDGLDVPEGAETRKGIEWRSGDHARSSIPLRLLEEIQDHHNVSGSTRKEVSEYRGRGEDSGSEIATNGLNLHTTHLERRSNTEALPHDIETSKADAAEEDEYESDKEHISSATYYPHEGPSTDGLEDTDPDHSSPFESSDDAAKPSETSSVSSIDEVPSNEPAAIPDTVRIEEQCGVHESSAKSRTSFEKPRPGKSDAGTSSASDSDYESWDDPLRSDKSEESGVTDGGDVTPTATPKEQIPHRGPKLRSTPLRAVELRPYKHQVGGHSNVYSFSKQAICKQLNNRENEFYEVVERKHPELLKYLPRYASSIHVYT